MPEVSAAPYAIIEDNHEPRRVDEAEYRAIKQSTVERLTEHGFLGTLRKGGKGMRKIEGIEHRSQSELIDQRSKFIRLLASRRV